MFGILFTLTKFSNDISAIIPSLIFFTKESASSQKRKCFRKKKMHIPIIEQRVVAFLKMLHPVNARILELSW